LGHFTFTSPHYLIVLVIVPLLFLYAVAVRRRRSRYAVAFTNVDLVTRLVARRPTHWWRRLPLILIALAMATSTAALARPRIQLTTSNRTATIILLVDISSSMQAHDVGQQRVGVGASRLEAAQTAMHDFLGQVPSNDKIGLVTFSDKVQVISQPTTNHSVIDSGLAVLKPQGGTALGAGVTAAVKMIVSSLAKDGVHHTTGRHVPAAIVLESDGAQNRGTITPASAAELARAAGIRIFGVALGRRNGYVLEGSGFFQLRILVPPDPGVVALLARSTGGKAYRATTGPSLDRIYRRLGSTVGSEPQVTEITSWFDAAAAVLLVCGLGAARVRGGALP
jgi:Ca-activated chloride channel family protein